MKVPLALSVTLPPCVVANATPVFWIAVPALSASPSGPSGSASLFSMATPVNGTLPAAV